MLKLPILNLFQEDFRPNISEPHQVRHLLFAITLSQMTKLNGLLKSNNVIRKWFSLMQVPSISEYANLKLSNGYHTINLTKAEKEPI